MDIVLPPDIKEFLNLLGDLGRKYLLIVSFDECFNASLIDKLDGIEVNIISLTHLKKNQKNKRKV